MNPTSGPFPAMTTPPDPADLRFRQFCETGDPNALGDVFDQTAGKLFRVAVWLNGNRNDAEDLLQRTFLKAIEIRHQFRCDEPVLPWLMGLLGNEGRRQRRERDRASAVRPAADQVVDPETTAIARELTATVSSIGERIGRPYREVLQLHLQAGLNCKEIAARLERPAGTVRTQLMRALDLLRQRLPAGFATGMAAAVAMAPGALANVRQAVARAAEKATATGPKTAAASSVNLKSLAIAAGTLVTAIVAFTIWSDAARSAQPVPTKVAAPEPLPTGAVTTTRQDPQRVPANAPEQDAPTVELPHLFVLGATPKSGMEVTVDAHGNPVTGSLATATPAAVILHVDRRAPWSSLTSILGELQQRGTKTVHFAARLPNGATGCFTLALPAAGVTTGTIELRLHRKRAGIPATSIVPVLRRLVRGYRKMVAQIDWHPPEEKRRLYPEPFATAICAPGDAEFEAVLRVIAATTDAGVTSVVCRSTATGTDNSDATAISRSGALAIDLGPTPRIAFRARALRTDPFERPTGVVGCPAPATANPAKSNGGGAGGAFGVRRPSQRTLEDQNGDEWTPGDHIEAGLQWLRAAQQPDGSLLGDDGRPNLEATALAMLALLANGVRVDGVDYDGMLGRGIGWILDQQQDDGCYSGYEPDYLRHHALATHAVAEAYGLSISLELRGSLDDALAWLATQQQDDDGFSNGVRGAPSDTASTATVLLALFTTEFFRVESSVNTHDIATWFDGETAQSELASDQAAAIFARFLVKQNPKRVPELAALAERLPATGDRDDPWCLHWTSHCLFQIGGQSWIAWREQLAALARRQVESGPERGSWDLGSGAARPTTTALCVLALQSSYRYSRLVR